MKPGMRKLPLVMAVASAAGLLCFALLMERQARSAWPCGVDVPSRVTKPNLAIELVRLHADVAKILGDPGTPEGILRRRAMGTIQYLDMPFIACYICLFIVIGLTLTLTPGQLDHLLGYATIVLIALAGLFDFLEDWSILQIVKLGSAAPEPGPIRAFALCKWGLFFLTLVLLSIWLLRWPRDQFQYWLFAVITGVGLLVAGMWGLTGVLISERATSDLAIEMAITLAAPVIALLLVPRVLYVLSRDRAVDSKECEGVHDTRRDHRA